jgi:hypothetical protein
MKQAQTITAENVVSIYRATIAHDAQWLAEFDACSADDQMTIACEELEFDPFAQNAADLGNQAEGIETMADCKPWYMHSPALPGDYLVTWWIPVRNARGTITLNPRSLRFETEQSAREAAETLSNARYADIRHGRDIIAKITQ